MIATDIDHIFSYVIKCHLGMFDSIFHDIWNKYSVHLIIPIIRLMKNSRYYGIKNYIWIQVAPLFSFYSNLLTWLNLNSFSSIFYSWHTKANQIYPSSTYQNIFLCTWVCVRICICVSVYRKSIHRKLIVSLLIHSNEKS